MTLTTRSNGDTIDASWFNDIKNEIEAAADNLTTKFSNYTIQSGDKIILVDASSNDVTITMPPILGNSGKNYYIIRIDNQYPTYNVTVDGDGTETIEGTLTKIIKYQYDGFQLTTDGSSQWTKISNRFNPNITGEVVGDTDSQTLTNKVIDGDSNSITNLAHGAEVDNPTSGVHGATGTIVGTSDAQTLTNKTFDNETTHKHITTPSNPSAGYLKFYAKSDDKFYKLTSAGAEQELGGAGAGGLSTTVAYVDDDMEAGVTDYTASGAGLTVAQETTTPLVDSASLKISKDAADRSGVYVHRTDFTIDEGYASSPMSISFLATTSANYADGDMKVIVYDVERSAEIETVPTEILAGTGGKFVANFQTGPFGGGGNEGDYELRFVVNSTNASAYDVVIDNVFVGPVWQGLGQPMTDPTPYTPGTNGFGTIANVNVLWERIGGSVHVDGSFTTGTCTAVEGRINLPSGVVSSEYTSKTPVGVLYRDASTVQDFVLLATAGDGYLTIGRRGNSSATNAFTNVNPSSEFANGEKIGFKFKVSIEGWGVTAQLASVDAARTTAAILTGAPATISFNETIIFPTITEDTHAGYNTITGEYTAPSSGYYRLHGFMEASIADGNFEARVNGVKNCVAGYFDPDEDKCSFSVTIKVDEGDKITLYSLSGVTSFTADCRWCIDKLQGNQQAMAGETVACRYTSNSGQTLTGVLEFEDKDYDTHNSYNVSTGQFIPPTAGIYTFTAGIRPSSSTAGAIQIYKNGTRLYVMNVDNGSNNTAIVSGDLQLVTTDYVEIRSNIGVAATTSGDENYLSIHKV